MADDKTQDTTTVSAVPIAPATDLQYYSASAVGAAGGRWTGQLIFQSLKLNPDMQGGRDVPELVVAMPWPLVKAVHHVLGTLIKSYEDTEGPIELPKSFKAKMEQEQ